MEPIVIQAETSIRPEDSGIAVEGEWPDRKVVFAAEGLSVERKSYEYEGKTYEHDLVEFVSEYAPVRPFGFADLRKGIVANINGQNYMIRIEAYSEEGEGIPSGATVVFIPTSQPETPWTPWDEETAKAEAIAHLQAAITACRGDEDLVDCIKDHEQRIQEIESGVQRLQPNAKVLLFGKPCFIQNPIFPARNGKVAQCLAVLETGWGDAGNINLLFACDDEGRPCKVWFEASCC